MKEEMNRRVDPIEANLNRRVHLIEPDVNKVGWSFNLASRSFAKAILGEQRESDCGMTVARRGNQDVLNVGFVYDDKVHEWQRFSP